MSDKKQNPAMREWIGGQYQPLSQSDIEQIHNAALDILGSAGVAVQE
jgi:trimethylamine:corrinoid methyltransferase-like protein